MNSADQGWTVIIFPKTREESRIRAANNRWASAQKGYLKSLRVLATAQKIVEAAKEKENAAMSDYGRLLELRAENRGRVTGKDGQK